MSKLLKEQWAKLAFGKRNTSINESVDMKSDVDSIVQQSIIGLGPEAEERFFKNLSNASSMNHFLGMCGPNGKWDKKLYRMYSDFSQQCINIGCDLDAALGYVKTNYADPYEIERTKQLQAAEPEVGYSDHVPAQWNGGSL